MTNYFKSWSIGGDGVMWRENGRWLHLDNDLQDTTRHALLLTFPSTNLEVSDHGSQHISEVPQICRAEYCVLWIKHISYKTCWIIHISEPPPLPTPEVLVLQSSHALHRVLWVSVSLLCASSCSSDHSLSVFVICVLLIPFCSSVSPLSWLSADGDRLFILLKLQLFLKHFTIYLKSSWSWWGAHLFWENLWWLGNTQRPKMDSSFSVYLRRPAVRFKEKRTQNKEDGGLLIKYLTWYESIAHFTFSSFGK